MPLHLVLAQKTKIFQFLCLSKIETVKKLMLYYQHKQELILNVNLKCTKHRYLAFAFMPYHSPPFLVYLHCELQAMVMDKCSPTCVSIRSRYISLFKSKLNGILHPAQRYSLNFRVAAMDTYVSFLFFFSFSETKSF